MQKKYHHSAAPSHKILWGRRRKKSSLKFLGPSFPGTTSRSSLIRKRNSKAHPVLAPLSPIVWLVSFQGQCESDEPEEPTVTTASCPASTVSVSVPIVPPPIPSNVPISTLLTPPIPLKFYGPLHFPLQHYGTSLGSKRSNFMGAPGKQRARERLTLPNNHALCWRRLCHHTAGSGVPTAIF